MSSQPFDPYVAESRQLWRNRLGALRANLGESAFSGLAWCSAFAFFAWVAIGQLPSLRAAVVWLYTHYPRTALCAFAAMVLMDHAQRRRAQRQRWASDWLCAQPIAPLIRRRRRLRALALRLTAQLALLGVLLSVAKANAAALLLAGFIAAAAACLGNWLGDIDSSPRLRPRSRKTLFTSTAVGSVWRWQWIEAGASIAPRHLAPLLLVILLVPRGPAVMAVAALMLVLMASGVSAWLRSVHVMIAAEHWLNVEPISARVWLAQCIRIPLFSLFIGALLVAGVLMPAANVLLAMIVGAGLLMLGTLYVAVVASERAQPRRIALAMTLHLVVLIAIAQTIALLVPVVFAVQLFVLTKRSLR